MKKVVFEKSVSVEYIIENVFSIDFKGEGVYKFSFDDRDVYKCEKVSDSNIVFVDDENEILEKVISDWDEVFESDVNKLKEFINCSGFDDVNNNGIEGYVNWYGEVNGEEYYYVK